MNLGLVTSFIIGGMLMLSIIVMNINLSTSSADLTLTQVNKQHVQTITDMITYDIPKIGFAQNGKVSKYNDPSTGSAFQLIEVADTNRIVFNSDIDNDGEIDEITWELTTEKVYDSQPDLNQNVYKLVRKQNAPSYSEITTEISTGVTKFVINYYDEYGDDKADRMSTPVTGSNLEDIKQIDIQLVIQSKEKIRYSVGSDGRYVTSAWEKRYTPRNLQ